MDDEIEQRIERLEKCVLQLLRVIETMIPAMHHQVRPDPRLHLEGPWDEFKHSDSNS